MEKRSYGVHLATAIEHLVTDPNNGWLCPFTEALAGLSANQAAWAPALGMNSIWGLVHHIRVEAEVVRLRLLAQPVDYTALGAPDGWPDPGLLIDEQAWEAACHRAVAAHKSLADLLRSLPDEALERPISANGPSRLYWVQGLLAHTQYHTGQILLLRRLQGSWAPLQWLPAADKQAEPSS